MYTKYMTAFCLIGQSVLSSAASEPTAEASSGTATLPPSPTGSSCHAHGDHWHCHPYSTTPPGSSIQVTKTCEPHGDHWHCPEGVPEPTSPPGVSEEHDHDHDEHEDHDGDHKSKAENKCHAHGDHWHCPTGVQEPPYAPNATSTLMPSITPTTASPPSPSVDQGAGGRLVAPASAIIGVVSFLGAALLGSSIL